MLRDPMGPVTYRKHNDPRIDSRVKAMRGFDFKTLDGFMDSFIRCGWWIVPNAEDNCGMRVVCNARRKS
jgi:hypothetical protein